MRKLTMITFLTIVALCFVVSPVSAVKPGEEVNPNRFPSGPHYNLNIIGKKAGFNCPAIEVDENNEAIYGKVIFAPEAGSFEILMESGRGKRAEAIPDLQVIDPCATDGTEAVMQLPKCDDGYGVYARALGKPTGEPYYLLSNPQLNVVQDDYGNDLIYLGELTDNGVVTADGQKSITRNKGKSKAIPISDLFEVTGYVCAFVDGTTDLTPTSVCWMDNPQDLDNEEVSYDDLFAMPDANITDNGGCPEGYTLVSDALSCSYYEDTWIFNVAEFAQCIWGLDNNGMKLLQIRFYPNGTQ